MQDGCQVYMDSYMASKWNMFHGHLDYFQKPFLRSRPNIKPRDHGIVNAYNYWFTLYNHVRGRVWIKIIEMAYG